MKMKKLLAIFLALVTVASISLASCNKKTETPDDDEWDNEDEYNYSTSASTNKADESDKESTDTDKKTTNTGNWIDKNDTVYTGMEKTNLREGPGSSYKIGKEVPMGTAMTRISTNGSWDKVKLNDVEYYVDSDLVTTDGNDFVFEADLETPVSLTINTGYQINLRSTPFYSEEYAGSNTKFSGIKPEDITAENPLMKIAVSKSGDWYKVTYKGATCYMSASSVTAGYVADPTVSTGGSNGGSSAIG